MIQGKRLILAKHSAIAVSIQPNGQLLRAKKKNQHSAIALLMG
jgi:hypothetical protein